ncbi:MAG: DUF6084 family protein [Caldilineaceae bacterium]
MPDLNFSIESADILPYGAVPTLLFKLRIDNRTLERVRSIMLKVQLQIPTAQRPYSEEEQARLWELFGEPARWSTTLKPVLWTQTTVLVPAFNDSTLVDLPIPCTYDFEVVSAKYFHALQEGDIPLEFLFSGTIFYTGSMGLQAAQISWEKEAHHRLPVGLWRALMDHYFPNSTWLRLRRDIFDRLHAYKMRHGLATWEAALEELLPEVTSAPADTAVPATAVSVSGLSAPVLEKVS